MSKGRTSTHRRFEERHPDLWDEVQAMIEDDQSQSSGRAEAPSILSRLFRASAGRARRGREDPS